jgi:hypothetical protein
MTSDLRALAITECDTKMDDLRNLQAASRRIMARAFITWCHVHFAHIRHAA